MFAIVVLALVFGASGCAPQLRGRITAEQANDFRSQSLEIMKKCVLSDEPVLRMQALEAYQEVAPREGLPYIVDNVDNGYAGVSFAALMALGTIRDTRFIEKVRLRAEDSDANVRIAAIYALHRMGDQHRTGELGNLLRQHPDPRVRANAALAIGRLNEQSSTRLLQTAAQQEKKDFVKMQIREALSMLGDRHAQEELIFAAHSAAPDQATIALMFLANTRADRAEEVFRYRLHHADQPEIRLEAARGLGRIGIDAGYDVAASHLFFNSPRSRKDDPPEQQIARIRGLAALGLEAIGNPDALGPLKQSFDAEKQWPGVRLAIARAAVGIISRPPGSSYKAMPPARKPPSL
jgi:HEAT repeat protein